MTSQTLRRSSFTLFGLATLAALAFTAPAQAQPYDRGYSHDDNQIRVRFGVFRPEANGQYWHDKFADFTGNARDFEGGTIGFDYLHEIAPMLDLLVTGDYYRADHDQAYRRYEDSRGNSIFHTTSLETNSVGLGLLVHLAPRRAPISPYIGAGGMAIAYRLREDGDFVDFGSQSLQVFRGHFKSDGVASGWFALAGLDIPLSRYMSLFVEGRYQNATRKLQDDFEGFGNLDLTGTSGTAGISFRF